MTEDDIDRLWARCTEEAIKAHEPFTKFRFAAAIRDAALEEAAGVCDKHAINWDKSWHSGTEKAIAVAICDCAAAIRAKKGQV